MVFSPKDMLLRWWNKRR